MVLVSAMSSAASPSPKAQGPKPKAAPPPRAHDYTAAKGLSQPRYTTFRHDALVPMADGRALYVEVVRPRADSGRFPVILEASPYHGTISDRDGTRILPGPRDPNTDAKLGLTGYFAPRGYAVVMVDLRGTGRSQGCLDHLGPNDATDLKIAIEWAARQPWSNGRVGMTGHSYVGATQALAAAQRPRGLVTIVPSAGLASMYDHQFQAGVPYNLQWVGPMEAYLELSVFRSVPATGIGAPTGGKVGYGDNVGRDPHEIGCGAKTSALTAGESQLSGQYVDWHRQRDFSARATDAPIPVFLVHGVNDNAARVPAMEWFSRRGPGRGDKLWLGQWDHGVGCCPNRRGEQWTAALHAWFDHHLAQRRVDTGPPVELFLADGTFAAAASGARTEIAMPGVWPPKHEMVELFPGAAERSLAGAPDSGSVSFAATAGAGGGVAFTSAPARSPTVYAGLPELRLVASVTSPRVHLIATLYDVDEAGRQRRITQFAMNPELREGIDRLTPVVPGQRYVLRPPGFTMAHHLRAGHSLSLRITTSDSDKVATFANDPLITVFTGRGGTQLRLPVLRRPTLVADDVFFQPERA